MNSQIREYQELLTADETIDTFDRCLVRNRELQDRETVVARAVSDSLRVPPIVAGQDQSELVASWLSGVLAGKT